ncbi:MAG: LppP/LprE family lipoprotein [Luteitalea sp.]|nr:LppP/LprE family lipoprotein [Luteitalea sp.]
MEYIAPLVLSVSLGGAAQAQQAPIPTVSELPAVHARDAEAPAREQQEPTEPPVDATETSAGSWLDRPVRNWNRPGAALPKPTKGEYEPTIDEQCKDSLRKGDGPEDTQVTQAGWSLFGSRQTYNDVTLVSGMSGADGMCRPFGYQVFIFVGGQFAGTIAPEPMASRMDGDAGPVSLFSDETLSVEFSRYKDTDPLCCPSGRTSVSYRIDREGAHPVLAPEEITPVSQP